jgi:hypothetical protein
MVIREYMRGIASLFPMRQSVDLRELLVKPLLNQRLVALQRTTQGPPAGDAELAEKPGPKPDSLRY